MAELPILHPGSVAGSQAKEARPMFNTEKIIRLSTVLARTGLSRSTLYRKIAEGTFPAQVRISVHGAGWHESARSEERRVGKESVRTCRCRWSQVYLKKTTIQTTE